MPQRNSFKVLEEKYDTLYTEVREVRLVPFDFEEVKVLSSLYDFKKLKDGKLRRIKAAGEVETLMKFSDNTFVCILDNARGVTKFEYTNFVDLTKHLSEKYKADISLDDEQEPKGKDMPYGITTGGQQ